MADFKAIPADLVIDGQEAHDNIAAQLLKDERGFAGNAGEVRVAAVSEGRTLTDSVEFALRLLCKSSALRTSGFTGLGVIFYRPPVRVPVVALGRRTRGTHELPVVGEDSIAQALAEIADVSSPLHDGFHLIDAVTKNLTMTSQFVSAPLPSAEEEPVSGWPAGARQMTALLISRLECVAAVGLLSAHDALVYSGGAIVRSVSVPRV